MPTSGVVLDTPDGPMPTYAAEPDGPAKGGIVVVQEAFGVTHHIEQIAARLGEAGWHAVAPALFHRQGSAVLAYDDLAAVMPVMQQLTAAGIDTDMQAAFEHLEKAGSPPPRQGVVGFCMGGSVVFHTACDHALGAAVTFYGGGIREGRFGYPAQLERARQLRTPWLGLYGDVDKGIPPEQVEELRSAAAAAPVPTEVVRYADADHGFNCNDRPAVYNPAAAGDAWARTLAWFDTYLAPG
ncbi:MAG TPA: dienelactone hydrolase family protein [Acidimicrobiales bacterium]